MLRFTDVHLIFILLLNIQGNQEQMKKKLILLHKNDYVIWQFFLYLRYTGAENAIIEGNCAHF